MNASHFCFVLLLEFCIHAASAMPVYIPPIGERNVIICGFLTVISVITLIGACAFCRRRKKKFELNNEKDAQKFENEATSCDSRPEFPIFRALNSPEQNSRQPAVIVPVHSQNQSQDNLLEPENNDNNNGPISTADLENIENNNAIDFIVTTNELNCGGSSAHNSNQNLLSCVPVEMINERVTTSTTNFDGIVLSPSPPCDGVETNSSLTSVSIFLSSDIDNENNSNFNYTTDSQQQLPLHKNQYLQQQQTNTFEDNFVFSVDDPNQDVNSDDDGLATYDVTLCVPDNIEEDRVEIKRWHDNEHANPFLDVTDEESDLEASTGGMSTKKEELLHQQWVDKAPEQCLSPESYTSKTSNEYNSVEEALRCLDNAISFGDTLDNDSDLDDDETIGDKVNDMSIAKVLEHFLSDGANNNNNNITQTINLETNQSTSASCNNNKTLIINNLNSSKMGVSEAKTSDLLLQNIHSQAIVLVDDVLYESQRHVEARQREGVVPFRLDTKIADLSDTEMLESQDWLSRTSDYKQSEAECLDRCDSLENLPKCEELEQPNLKSCDSEEDLLFKDLPTSTPFHSKFAQPVLEEGSKKRMGAKLFEETLPMLNVTETLATNKSTFLIAPSDETFMCEDKNNRTFNLPPEIKIDRDDTISEDMTTTTPLNTPIELNYNIETWDKFIHKKQYAVDDIGVPHTLNASAHNVGDGLGNDSSGWFLHPQNKTRFDEDTFDVTEQQFADFAGDGFAEEAMDDDDNENMNATFDQLRKQLTEMLPHAQGMSGQFDNFEEPTGQMERIDDNESQQAGSSHYGIKYGDLDEATNVLDELAGLIINNVGDSDTITEAANANEMFINYKRTLSPIMEESEEDMTCKTFVLNNDTRMMESTSTEPCIEEAIMMGVPKALMASNDTLFNFEDTLGDGESISASCSPRPPKYEQKITEQFLAANTVSIDQVRAVPERPTDFGFDIMPPPCEILYVLSPDQPKTADFSQEHDLTYTMEEKTCISVRDDEMISEISEPDMLSLSSGFDRANLSSLNQDDSTFVSETCARNDITLEGASEKVNESSTSIESMLMSPRDAASDMDLTLENEIGAVNKTVLSIASMVISPKEDERLQSTEMDDLGDMRVGVETANDETENRTVLLDHIIQVSPQLPTESSCVVEIKETNDNTSKPLLNESNVTTPSTDNHYPSPSDSPIDNTHLHISNDQLNQITEDDSDSLIKSIIATNSETDPAKKCSEQNEHEQTGSNSSDNDSNKENRQQLSANIINFLTSEIQYSSSQYYNNSNNSSSYNQSNHYNSNKQKLNNTSVTDSGDSGVASAVHSMSSTDSETATIDSNKEMVMSNSNAVAWNTPSVDEDGDIIYKESKNHNAYDYGFDLHPNANNKHNLNNLTIHDIDFDDQECGLMIADKIMIGQYLSGEEDPWVADDIRLAKIVSENMMMSTSFAVPEWDSEDDDDTNSSEEFMYVKGSSLQQATTNAIDEEKDEGTILEQPVGNAKDTKLAATRMTNEDSHRAWLAHKDKVAVVVGKDIPEEVGSEADESSSENEGEFVPSCWDSMAQPQRSALKSPDKANEAKGKRNVAFKIKRYHSVYEYPRETIELSPAYSEPDLWTGDYSRHLNYLSTFADDFKEQIDGFTITSSNRPFHGSQFHAQCNTWPTDSDFSWSQYEDNDMHQNTNNDSEKSSSEVPSIDWQRDLSSQDADENSSSRSPITENDFQRPDSGVGESAELLSESLSLGDLCHAKSTLRLSLNINPSTEATPTTEISDIVDTHILPNITQLVITSDTTTPPTTTDDTLDESIKLFDSILPTPSCTGSLDSLSGSSSSGSSDHRPPSFTTFGKKQNINHYLSTNNSQKATNENNDYIMTTKIPSIVLIEDCEQQTNDVELMHKYANNKMNRSTGARLSDSTDEDSGIENMSRLISK